MSDIVQRIQDHGAPQHREPGLALTHENGEYAIVSQYSGIRGRQRQRALICFTGARELER